jgi:hypothetical protein
LMLFLSVEINCLYFLPHNFLSAPTLLLSFLSPLGRVARLATFGPTPLLIRPRNYLLICY